MPTIHDQAGLPGLQEVSLTDHKGRIAYSTAPERLHKDLLDELKSVGDVEEFAAGEILAQLEFVIKSDRCQDKARACGLLTEQLQPGGHGGAAP